MSTNRYGHEIGEVEQACPKCGEECCRDDVDVGVGVIYGPWGCPACGWSSDSEYDQSNGPSPAQMNNPGWYVDQTGGMRRISAFAEDMARFGLKEPEKLADEVFGVSGCSPRPD